VHGSFEDYTRLHPRTAEFVAEICVTSEEYDRSKIRAYATAGVKEYWLVLHPKKTVEIHRKPSNGKFLETMTVASPGQLISEVFPDVSVDLEQLFRE
jgi:Uma2 family endonuclease